MVARITVAGTQTDTSEFLDLRQLQLASSQQHEQLTNLRGELQSALSAAAMAVEQSASNTASERDDHYRSVVRHLERTHKQALEHERAAHAATLNNELTKQRQTIERRIRDELHEASQKREALLVDCQSELQTLRARIARREDELATLTSSSSRDRAALEAERDRVTELEAEAVKQAREREAEKLRREKNGFYVEAEQLHACEAQLIEMTAKYEGATEAHASTRETLEQETSARHSAEDALKMTKEQLASANADIEESVFDAGRTAARHESALARVVHEHKVAKEAIEAESKQKAELANMLVSRQGGALKKLADENVSLLKMLSGMPTLKNAVANAPPGVNERPPEPVKPHPGESADDFYERYCTLCGFKTDDKKKAGDAEGLGVVSKEGAAAGAATDKKAGGLRSTPRQGGRSPRGVPARGRAAPDPAAAGSDHAKGAEVISALRKELDTLKAENAKLRAAGAPAPGATAPAADDTIDVSAPALAPRPPSNGSQSARSAHPPPGPKPPAQPLSARPSLPGISAPPAAVAAAAVEAAGAKMMVSTEEEGELVGAPPQRMPTPPAEHKYVSEALFSGDATYGRRARPGHAQLHSGVDELGFSTAWRNQPRY